MQELIKRSEPVAENHYSLRWFEVRLGNHTTHLGNKRVRLSIRFEQTRVSSGSRAK